jgi:hypothetical protein
MGRAADVRLEHRYAHEELEGLDEALRGEVTVAYGESVCPEVDDVIVAVDDISSDDAGDGFAEEAGDVFG